MLKNLLQWAILALCKYQSTLDQIRMATVQATLETEMGGSQLEVSQLGQVS
jgi:hypothetical protein